jgi:predicted transcriptional regulator
LKSWQRQWSGPTPTSRPRPFLAYVDLNEWQIEGIKTALKEADAGDFAEESEVQAVVKKWRRGAR